MNILEIEKIIESFCPSTLAEEWDNCGFQILCGNNEIEKILVALEITDSVIDEAIENNIDMIITHHPLLFNPIKSINNNNYIGRKVNKLIKSNISVYSTHTNFDKMVGGNNDYFGQILNIKEIKPFINDNEFCRQGVLEDKMTLADFTKSLSVLLNMNERFFNVVGDGNSLIKKIGWCTGAGSEFIKDAEVECCDLFITGDLKYHDAQMAKDLDICVIDAGHYGTEKCFIDNMSKLLQSKIDIKIIKSNIDINPFIC